MLRTSLAILLVACNGAPEPPECTWCSPPSSELELREDTAWLVHRVRFAQRPSGTQLVAGFDLDGVDTQELSSSECERGERDYASSLDSSITGVDNAGQSLISAGEMLFPDSPTFQEALDAAVGEGRVRWAIRLGELDADDKLAIEFLVIDEGQTIALDPADGLPAAGQALSATVAADTDADVRGATAWGVSLPSDPIGDADVFLLPFADFRLAAVGVRAAGVPALTAQIGGTFSVDALSELAVRVGMGSPSDEALARMIFEMVADLGPSAEDPRTCERVSVGFELDLVPMSGS
jgi:hypothetical protein